MNVWEEKVYIVRDLETDSLSRLYTWFMSQNQGRKEKNVPKFLFDGEFTNLLKSHDITDYFVRYDLSTKYELVISTNNNEVICISEDQHVWLNPGKPLQIGKYFCLKSKSPLKLTLLEQLELLLVDQNKVFSDDDDIKIYKLVHENESYKWIKGGKLIMGEKCSKNMWVNPLKPNICVETNIIEMYIKILKHNGKLRLENGKLLFGIDKDMFLNHLSLLFEMARYQNKETIKSKITDLHTQLKNNGGTFNIIPWHFICYQEPEQISKVVVKNFFNVYPYDIEIEPEQLSMGHNMLYQIIKHRCVIDCVKKILITSDLSKNDSYSPEFVKLKD